MTRLFRRAFFRGLPPLAAMLVFMLSNSAFALPTVTLTAPTANQVF